MAALDGGSVLVHPEMNEKLVPSKLFHVEHNYGSSYGLTWLESRDAEARAVLKSLRVRPAFKTDFRVEETGPGKSSYGMWPGQRVVHCLVTSNAEEKLMKSGHCCYEALLD